METRRELVRRVRELFPEGQFIYGGYREKPNMPYGNYSVHDVRVYKTDDSVSIKFEWLIFRFVTENKDFELEDTFTDICDEMDLNWEFYDEASAATGTKAGLGMEKAHAVEYLVEVPRW